MLSLAEITALLLMQFSLSTSLSNYRKISNWLVEMVLGGQLGVEKGFCLSSAESLLTSSI
jgi:hypothetical protein